jgi:hypothetical protein
MRSFDRHIRALFFALPAFGAALTFAPEAQANSGLSGLDTVVAIIGGCIVLGVGDLVLTGSDLYYLSNDRHPAAGWSISKVVFGVPQALFFNGILASGAASGDSSGTLIFGTLAGAYTTSLATNGIWLLASDRDPLSLYGLSWAIGANTAFTSAAVGTIIGKKWPGRAFGLFEMVAMTPTLTVGAVRLADPTSERIAWGVLMGWSGVLFTHGLVSAIHGDSTKNEQNTQDNSEETNEARAGFPSRFYFGPTMVTDGIQRLPGFSVGGVF